MRFGSHDGLNQHLIIKHNGSVVDPDTDDDNTSYDENEELNLDLNHIFGGGMYNYLYCGSLDLHIFN